MALPERGIRRSPAAGMDAARRRRAQCRLAARIALPFPMTRLTPLATLHAPLGKQDIELQQIDFPGGGMSLLRTRIREGKRFTIFDIDPVTARQWGRALLDWAEAQPRE